MALPFPIIPFAPGVPAIPRLPGSIPAVVDLLVADVLSFLGITLAPQWGLFMNGFPAVIAESVVAFDYRKSYEIPTYPIEDGSFESYNKVERPFDVRLRFTMGGTVADRQAFEATVQEAIASTEFFEAVTPEVVYSSVNPIRMDYVRKASNGVGLLTIDVFCEEVRVGASSSFTSTSSGSTTSTVGSSPTSTQGTVKFRDTPSSASIVSPQSPSASPQINAGVVQPALPTVAQQSAVQFSLSQALP
jgi:hypothetical protein